MSVYNMKLPQKTTENTKGPKVCGRGLKVLTADYKSHKVRNRIMGRDLQLGMKIGGEYRKNMDK